MLCPGDPVSNSTIDCPELAPRTTFQFFPNIADLRRGDIILTCPQPLKRRDDKFVVKMQELLGLPPQHARFTHAMVYDPDYWIWDVDLHTPVSRRLLSIYVDAETCLEVIRPYTLTTDQCYELLAKVAAKQGEEWTLAITNDLKEKIVHSQLLQQIQAYVETRSRAKLMLNNTARSFTCASVFLDSWNELVPPSHAIADSANIPYGPGHLGELVATHPHWFTVVKIEWVDITHCL
jgi:hypothetical protein